MKGGGGSGASGQSDKNAGVFSNPSTGWQWADMVLTLRRSPAFAQ